MTITADHILLEIRDDARTPVRLSVGALAATIYRVGVSSRSYAVCPLWLATGNVGGVLDWHRTGDMGWAEAEAAALLLAEANKRFGGAA